VDGANIFIQVETGLEVERLAIFDGEYVGEEAAENMERWEAYQPCHLVRDDLRDALVLCNHGGM